MENYDMSEEEFVAEIIWSKIQSKEYVVIEGIVIDPNMNIQICRVGDIGLYNS